ncbi:hypothetical protein HY030_01260 [Candidatus Gottesmanbacteria bacterium]|nr:hypothetical protein [Candidatus Gottesmanbacteria bacterium]
MKSLPKTKISTQQLLGKLQKYWSDNKGNKKIDLDLLKKAISEVPQSSSKKDN